MLPGARQMNEATRGNIGRNMAILLSETKVRTVTELLPSGDIVSSSEPYEEIRVISAPTIQAASRQAIQDHWLNGQ